MKNNITNKNNTNSQKEQERKQKLAVLSGKIKPIQTPYNLEKGEHAYYQIETDRMADREHITSHQNGQARSPFIKGGIMRGNTQINTTITHSRYDINERVDHGMLLFTNLRIIFVGKDIVSIHYPEIMSIHFPNPAKPHYPDAALSLDIRYPKMLKNESYILHDKEAEMYFRGIMRNIKKDKSVVKEGEVELFMDKKFEISKKIIVTINDDGSIECPQCDMVIKDYLEGKTFSIFGRGKKWRRYICSRCNRFISNALKDVEYSNL